MELTIILHGTFMFIYWAILVPIGLICIKDKLHHAKFMMIASIFPLMSLISIFIYRGASFYILTLTHHWIGLIIALLSIVNSIVAFQVYRDFNIDISPKTHTFMRSSSSSRSSISITLDDVKKEKIHKWLSFVIICLVTYNGYLGLEFIYPKLGILSLVVAFVTIAIGILNRKRTYQMSSSSSNVVRPISLVNSESLEINTQIHH